MNKDNVMGKKDFDKFIRRNYEDIKAINIRIWNGNEFEEDSSWLEVYFEMEDYPEIYTSDLVPETQEDKKILYTEQKKWKTKINRWLKDHKYFLEEEGKEIKVVVDEQNI